MFQLSLVALKYPSPLIALENIWRTQLDLDGYFVKEGMM